MLPLSYNYQSHIHIYTPPHSVGTYLLGATINTICRKYVTFPGNKKHATNYLSIYLIRKHCFISSVSINYFNTPKYTEIHSLLLTLTGKSLHLQDKSTNSKVHTSSVCLFLDLVIEWWNALRFDLVHSFMVFFHPFVQQYAEGASMSFGHIFCLSLLFYLKFQITVTTMLV